jgi:hypothetical protein
VIVKSIHRSLRILGAILSKHRLKWRTCEHRPARGASGFQCFSDGHSFAFVIVQAVQIKERIAKIMPEATWKPHEKHGRLTTQSDLPESVYAFPTQRKEPLTDAQHVRNAVARFNQVTDVSDAERALAFANIEKAARHYGVNLAETSWHDLGVHPQKSRSEAATEGAATRERRVKVGRQNKQSQK